MSGISDGPEAQDLLFESPRKDEKVPANLVRATLRLQFPPTYVVVGVYRLFTDKLLYIPAWDKCKHATRRGAIVGAIWTFLTFNLQKKFIKVFLANSPRVTGLSSDTMFGYRIPFNLHTYAAVLLLGLQTITSRGKGPDFWQPYVEEWDSPPVVKVESRTGRFVKKWLGGWLGMFVIKRVLLLPFDFFPFVGIFVSAWFKALGTAHNLHRRYFESKKMTEYQTAVFMEERKWDYRMFGFAAALLEGLPFIGIIFTISNRVGAAMWAHDLEKRQHFVAAEKAKHLSNTDKPNQM